jgi:hypothetical protein
MKIRAEYQAMGMWVADDLDGDPEAGVRGAGKSQEAAIDDLVAQLIDRAEDAAYTDGYETAQKDSAALLSEGTNQAAILGWEGAKKRALESALEAEALRRYAEELKRSAAFMETRWIEARRDAGGAITELRAAREAIKGLLGHLPQLWGDSVVEGQFTLTVEANAVYAALDALAKNVIPTGTKPNPNPSTPDELCNGQVPKATATNPPEAGVAGEGYEISNDPTKAEPAFRAWLEGFDPDALKQLVGPGITPGRVHEYQSAFYAGRVSLWAEALSHQRGTQPDPERRLRVSKTPYGEIVLTIWPSRASAVFTPSGDIARGMVDEMDATYECHRTYTQPK